MFFAEISDDPKSAKTVDQLEFLIGAKFACLSNSLTSPFKPVYLWGPCVCPQSTVWNPKTKQILNSFPAKSGEKINTYKLYMETLKKCEKFKI